MIAQGAGVGVELSGSALADCGVARAGHGSRDVGQS
jgi:hypothetical protein